MTTNGAKTTNSNKMTTGPNIKVTRANPPATSMDSDLFSRQIQAMAEHGLDVPMFLAWLEENEESIMWPTGSLACYFQEKAEIAEAVYGGRELDNEYFKLMGIVDDPAQLSFLTEWYLDAKSLGVMAEELLAEYYSSIACETRLEWYTEQMILGLQEKSMSDFETKLTSNTHALKSAQAGQLATIQVQKFCDSCVIPTNPEFEPKEVRILEELPDDGSFLFHSTTLESACSIMATCPFTGIPSSKIGDFDSGVYFNVSKSAAMGWLQKMTRKAGCDGAVLVYQVPDSEREKWRILKLTYSPEWAVLVRAFRSKNYYPINLRYIQTRYDVIVGPILANPREVARNIAIPRPLDYTQVCILDRAIAGNMNDYLVGIYIVSRTR